jgi:hypothetical protein
MSVRDFTQGILDRAQRRILDMKPGVLNKAARAAYYSLLVPPVLLARGAAAVAPVAGAAAVLTVEMADALVAASNARARFECDLCTDHVDCYRCHCDCDVADMEIVLWSAPRPRRHFVLFP